MTCELREQSFGVCGGWSSSCANDSRWPENTADVGNQEGYGPSEITRRYVSIPTTIHQKQLPQKA